MQKNKIIVALSTLLMTLLIGFMVFPDVARASDFDTETSALVNTYTCTINGVDRTLLVYEDGCIYLAVGEDYPHSIYTVITDIGFDKYGTVWILNDENTLCWFSYDLSNSYDVSHGAKYAYNVESLVFDSQRFVIGYKKFSDDTTYPILTLDEIRASFNTPDNPTPTPTPTPTAPSVVKPTPTPTPAGPSVVNPTPTPVVPSVVNPTPLIVNPNVTPNLSTRPKVANNTISLKKSAGYSCLYKGNTVVSKFKIKKSVLTWQGNGKTKTFKGVKKAGFIKKSNNLIFMTKKGQVYTLSPNGKKKTILKKGAKKLVFEGGYVTKVKKASGSVNVTKK